jgi:hypothetical protein
VASKAMAGMKAMYLCGAVSGAPRRRHGVLGAHLKAWDGTVLALDLAGRILLDGAVAGNGLAVGLAVGLAQVQPRGFRDFLHGGRERLGRQATAERRRRSVGGTAGGAGLRATGWAGKRTMCGRVGSGRSAAAVRC